MKKFKLFLVCSILTVASASNAGSIAVELLTCKEMKKEGDKKGYKECVKEEKKRCKKVGMVYDKKAESCAYKKSDIKKKKKECKKLNQEYYAPTNSCVTK
jgi:hypothetical protein